MKKVLILALMLASLFVLVSCAAPQGEIVELSDGTEETTDSVVVDESADSVASEAEVTAEVVEAEDSEEDSEESVDEESTEENEESESSEEESVETILITDKGFDPREVTLSVGETVRFSNEREGGYPDEIVMGVRSSRGIDSPLLSPGDTWEYAFEEAGEYQFVGQYLVTYDLKITVE